MRGSAMGCAHIAFVVEHPGVPGMMFGQLQTPESTVAKRMAQTSSRSVQKVSGIPSFGFMSRPGQQP